MVSKRPYSKAAIQTINTRRTMATTMTQNQIGWKQFASTLSTRNDVVNDHPDQDNEISDITPSANTRASRANKQKHSKHTGQAKTVKWSNTIVITPSEQPVDETAAFDAPKKAKTRAQRRAVEEIQEPTAPLQKETRREQRTDYWVIRDDKRRSSARAMKLMNTME
jgi:hypothetical protein